MVTKSKLIIIAVMVVAQLLTVASIDKITVLTSKPRQFHDAHKMSAFERLDSKLIETFAKKYKLDIEYIVANDTLNEMFGTENGSKNLLKSIQGL